MANKTKLEFRDFVKEEILPELVSSSGYTEEELMQQEVEIVKLDEPETFNGEVMNNCQLQFGDYKFDCFLDNDLIEKVVDHPMKFVDLLAHLY